MFGYDSGVMTDVIRSPHFLAFFHTKQTSAIVGAINSVFSGGAVFGALFGGELMDGIGRRWTIQIGACICLFGAILQAAARNLSMMLVGRIFTGFAIGLMSMSVPVYQSECAHPKYRGNCFHLVVFLPSLTISGLMIGVTQQMIGVGFIGKL
jgi:MFS family permease